jgi:hypothetical protein
MIRVRKPEEIHQARGIIENGTFTGRWHFSFDDYQDPDFMHFGTLRVLNDDTLSPGAVWPLHPHREIEVVTYCVDGVFRHADDHGVGGVLHKGCVQHTTVGRGLWHSEINDRPDLPMRFIQMWFRPSVPRLKPSVEQRKVNKKDRTNRFLPLVSSAHPDALPIHSDAQVHALLLLASHAVEYPADPARGVYLCLLEGGPVELNGVSLAPLAAARITGETILLFRAAADVELLLVDVSLQPLP